MAGRLSVGRAGAAATGVKEQNWFTDLVWLTPLLLGSLSTADLTHDVLLDFPLHILSLVFVGVRLFSLPFDLFIRSPC